MASNYELFILIYAGSLILTTNLCHHPDNFCQKGPNSNAAVFITSETPIPNFNNKTKFTCNIQIRVGFIAIFNGK